VVAVEEMPREKVSLYGIISGKKISDRLWQVDQMVEKPDIDKSSTNLAFAARYILTPAIFDALDATKPGKNNEIQLTDAMSILLQSESIYANVTHGKRYDIGSKMSYLKTIVHYGLKRKEFAEEFKEFLEDLVKSFGDSK
jgi:UTP--glucose-1-phosphate uridylyltransferase